jgi:hypothetical protein
MSDDNLTIPDFWRRDQDATKTAPGAKEEVCRENLGSEEHSEERVAGAEEEVCSANPGEETSAEEEKAEDADRGDKSELYREAYDAWYRLKAGAHQTWSDWLIIGRAMTAARSDLMRRLLINAPQGSPYRTAFKHWLGNNQLDDIDKTTRSLLLKLIDHGAEVAEMMATWSDAERAARNSPSAVYRAWTQWRAKQGKSSNQPTEPKQTRQQLLRQIEQQQAHINELEAAREVSGQRATAIAVTEPERSFNIDNAGDIRLVAADGGADRDLINDIKTLFESSDRVSFICERDGVVYSLGRFTRAERRDRGQIPATEAPC